MRFEYDAPIILKNKKLFEFLVFFFFKIIVTNLLKKLLKRQLHLLYDMICDVDLIHHLMGDKVNLVLKENLFSLKNCLEIYNGALFKYIEKCLNLLTMHVDGCNVSSKFTTNFLYIFLRFAKKKEKFVRFVI